MALVGALLIQQRRRGEAADEQTARLVFSSATTLALLARFLLPVRPLRHFLWTSAAGDQSGQWRRQTCDIDAMGAGQCRESEMQARTLQLLLVRRCQKKGKGAQGRFYMEEKKGERERCAVAAGSSSI